MTEYRDENIETVIAKLLMGAMLTDEEVSSLAKLSWDELAIRAVNITSNQLLALRNPRIIINAAAAIYGQIADNLLQNGMEKTENFKVNLIRIEAIQKKEDEKKDKGR